MMVPASSNSIGWWGASRLRSAALRALAVTLGLWTAPGQSQQIPDRNADVTVTRPAFTGAERPSVAIDGGHDNFHTLEGRFAPFAALLRNDGLRVSAIATPLPALLRADVDILVIANALHPLNVENWTLPTPSAFSAQEIAALQRWVMDGGSLLLIADHFPFAGAAQQLAAAFGFELINGFALAVPARQADIFTLESGTLRDDAITRGRNAGERVTALATFTGSAFRPPPSARPLIVLPQQFVLLLPSSAWQFDEQTPRRPGAGYAQGAVMRYGAGRLAVFAEAGMFTAQVSATGSAASLATMGFNAPEAVQNKQFILNTLRWLAGALPDEVAPVLGSGIGH